MNKRKLALIALFTGVFICIGAGAAAYWLMQGHGSTTAATEHHGMSPALWVAVFVPVWVAIMTASARRRRDKAGKAGGRNQS